MYLILLIFIVPLARSFGNGPVFVPWWVWCLPLLGVNAWSGWAGLSGNRHYWNALTLLYIDMTAMLAVIAYALYSAGRFGPVWPYALATFAFLAVGGAFALYVARLGKLPRWLVPVGGLWGRRLFAGVATLWLLPLSPGVLISLTMWFMRVSATDTRGPMLGSIWLISSLFYLAPLYRRIAEGVPPNLTVPRFATEVPDLESILAAHATAFPAKDDALARFIFKNEKPILEYFLREMEPEDAANYTRALIHSLWSEPPAIALDQLELSDLEDRLFWELLPGWACNELFVDEAIRSIPDVEGELTAEWLGDPTRFVAVSQRLGLTREVAVRRLCLGIFAALKNIRESLGTLAWSFGETEEDEAPSTSQDES